MSSTLLPVKQVTRVLNDEARKVARQDWGPLNGDRDRYVQGMRDAVIVVRRLADRVSSRAPRKKK